MFENLHGCLLVAKPRGISSFGVLESLQRALRNQAQKNGISLKRRDLPKFGHGGTLDPFATGLLLVCVGEATKLSRYFLGSRKEYRARIRFGATTIPGDPTAPISETCSHLPNSLEDIQARAQTFTQEPYLQVPPMHSAKKIGGQVLYELAREGIEIDRQAVAVRIDEFEIQHFEAPCAEIRVRCSAGTYIRVLAQDLGRRLDSLAYLETLERTASGRFRLESTQSLDQLVEALQAGELLEAQPAFVKLDQMLDGFPKIELSAQEARQLRQGQTHWIDFLEAQGISDRLAQSRLAIDRDDSLVVALVHAHALVATFSRKDPNQWQLDRVFCERRGASGSSPA
ncbi:MAG: tRNA pseudouridine(55) synthase TruB [Pseudomonadota bacterium]|jgi:tRNA pseudouridine55 synthase